MAELAPVYLLSGADRPKIARALERLRRHFAEDGIEHLSAGEKSGEDAVAACNVLGLFGGGSRLVIVGDVERWKAPDVKAVAAYLESPAPDTVLALLGEEIKKDSALAKACAKRGQLLVYDVAKRDLPRWVGEQIGRGGASATRSACERLVEIVGEDLYELASEADKLATWAAGAEVGERDVQILAAGRAETQAFALTDAWGARDLRAVLGAAQSLLAQGGDSRREETRLAAVLASHASKVAECQRLDAEGVSARETAQRWKRHPFYVEKLYKQAANFSVEELRDATVRLARLDHALKGGSRLSGELELELALVEITQPAAR